MRGGALRQPGLGVRLVVVLVVAGLSCAAGQPLEGSSIVQTGQSLKQLKLCDCHFRQAGDSDDGGSPEDLTCDAEGFFVAGFERAGVFSVRTRTRRCTVGRASERPGALQWSGALPLQIESGLFRVSTRRATRARGSRFPAPYAAALASGMTPSLRHLR